MTKTQRKSIVQLINIILFFIGLALAFSFKLNIYYLFGVLIMSTLISQIIGLVLPHQNNKKGKTIKNKNTKTKKNSAASSHKKVKQLYNTKNIPNSRLLPDNEILKLKLEEISSAELEQLIYLFYKSKGYKPEKTKNGADGGIDLIYFDPENGKTAVQIKHYIKSGRQIDVKLIRELNSAKNNYKCIFSEFITTSTFTNPALAEVPRGMNTKDIYWFRKDVIPWMEKERKKRHLA